MQTSYSNQPVQAFAGLIADAGARDIISRLNSAYQLFSVVVTTAANAEDFIVTIDGTSYTYTSDGSATKKEISDGLKALIAAGSADVTLTTFQTAVADDSFYIENNSYDTEITVSITNPATGVLTLTELVDHEDTIPFGAVVSADDRETVDSITGRSATCRLPRLNADVTSRRVLGVAIADTSLSVDANRTAGYYKAGESVPILRKGRIWMTVEDVASVAAGGLVYVRSTATGTELLGAIRAADDAGDTDPIDSNAAVFTGQVDTTNSLAVVEWNLP